MTTRTEFIGQLRQLADLLEQHPAIPTPDYPDILCCRENDAWAEFNQLAAYLRNHGIEFAGADDHGQRSVDLLGGFYHVFSNSSERMRRFKAASSYHGAVTP